MLVRKPDLRMFRALVGSLLLLSATAVAGVATLAGTPVIPGCPCIFFETTAADGVRSIGLDASAIGALLIGAFLLLALAWVTVRISGYHEHASYHGAEKPRDDAPRHSPVLALVRITSRKDRFSLGASTSFAGITHSPV